MKKTVMNTKFTIALSVLLCMYVSLSAEADSTYTKGWTTSVKEGHNVEVHNYLQAIYPSVQTYLQQKVSYPCEAERNNTQGRVSVQYRINPKGEIRDIRIIEKADSLLNNEVLTVIKKMPKYTLPYTHYFEQDSATSVMRINFILKDSPYATNSTSTAPIVSDDVCFVGEITVTGLYTLPKPKVTATVSKIKKYKWWQFWK